MQLDQWRFITNCIFEMNHFSVGNVTASRAKHTASPSHSRSRAFGKKSSAPTWIQVSAKTLQCSQCQAWSIFSASCLCPWVTVLLSRATLNSAVSPVTSSHYKTEPGLLGDMSKRVCSFSTQPEKQRPTLPYRAKEKKVCNAYYLAALCILCWARALGVVLHGNQQKCR